MSRPISCLFAGIGLLILLVGCKFADKKQNEGVKLRAFYVPVDLNTYLPTTCENIEQVGSKINIQAGHSASKIIELLKSGETSNVPKIEFKNQFVRIKIIEIRVDGSERVLACVEKSGAIRMLDKQDGTLTQSELIDLKEQILKFSN
jgi:hypothetical protein